MMAKRDASPEAIAQRVVEDTVVPAWEWLPAINELQRARVALASLREGKMPSVSNTGTR